MNILLVVPSLRFGGGERACVNLAKGLSSLGHDVNILVLKSYHTNAYELNDTYATYLNSKKTLFSIFKYRKFLKKNNYDIVCSFLDNTNVVSYIVHITLLRRSHKLVMTWHSEINGKLNDKFWLYRFVVKILINKCLCFADLSVTVSKKNKRNIQSLFSDDVSNMHVIPNPVFDSNLLNDLVVEKIIDKCFIDSLTLGTPRIISVGRLDKVKRHDFLLKAACSLIYNNCCELFIIGTGPEESNLRSLSKKLNIESGVHFLGFQNNPYKYLANSSVFVLTSRRESFGNVLVEAMACGLTPVSVDCPYGPAEILAQGKYGYLVENDSVESLRKSISKALTNPIDSQKLKKRASEYSINKISKSYEYIFLQILK